MSMRLVDFLCLRLPNHKLLCIISFLPINYHSSSEWLRSLRVSWARVSRVPNKMCFRSKCSAHIMARRIRSFVSAPIRLRLETRIAGQQTEKNARRMLGLCKRDYGTKQTARKPIPNFYDRQQKERLIKASTRPKQ